MRGCLLIAAICTALGQSDAASRGERDTCIVILKDGTELPVFWDDRKETRKDVYWVERDTPWEPKSVTIKGADVKDVVSERPRERQRRLRQGWTDAGYTEVNGRYYRTEEVGLANRAREMAGVKESAEAPPAPDDAPEVDNPPAAPVQTTPEAQPPGFVRQWWMHGALVLAALVLIGVVVKTMLMAG